MSPKELAAMLDKAARVGRQAALAAGAVIRQNYEKPHRVTLKGAIDPVTETDLQAQKMIANLVRLAFPEHGFLGEERVGEEKDSDQTPANPEYRWIVDPLDGTVNFAHGFPMFCVSIAFEAQGKVLYGAVYDPMRDELFEGRAGQGAFLNGRPIKVTKTAKLERALVATGFPYDIRERLPETLARLGRMLGATQGLRRAGSAALDMCYVASGRLDGFYEENLKPWDTAAGLVIVTEAGGKVTTFDGAAYDIYAPNILASNGLLHARLLPLLKVEE